VISALLAVALLLTDAAPTGAPAPHVDAPASDPAAAPRPAAEDKTAVKEATVDVKAAKTTRVCHYEEISGSRIPKKVCS
jgi:hypothetical protein